MIQLLLKLEMLVDPNGRLGHFKKLFSHYQAWLARVHKDAFFSSNPCKLWSCWNGPFSRDLHTFPCVSDLLHTVGVGAPTAGATDVKAGKPYSQCGGINGALTLQSQLWPFKC